MSTSGPARRANLRTGDIVLAVAGDEVSDLAGFFRRVWSLGKAGVEVPLTVYRDGRTFEVRVASGDRNLSRDQPAARRRCRQSAGGSEFFRAGIDDGQSSGPFFTFFISVVRPPLRLIQSFTVSG